MTPRELADLCERAPGFDAETLREIADTLRAQADEIATLKAAAIVAGSIKLDEAAKQAARREAVKAAWVRITSGRGWLSCMDTHDCLCPKFHDGRADCTCFADEFRRLMEE